MNTGPLRLGVSYSALLWALAVAAPQPAVAAPSETVLHNFAGGTDGAYPIGRPIENGQGGFYGLTPQGGYPNACGKKGCGVVYELTPPKAAGKAWAETVIYRFKGGSDSAAPLAALLRDRTGALYGTTSEGGGAGDCHTYYSALSGMSSQRFYWIKGAKVGCGTVFKLTPPAKGGSVWSESVLYRFNGKEGRAPSGTLLIDKTGALYGAAKEGGKGQCGYFSSATSFGGHHTSALQYRTGCGAVFKLTPPATGQTVWTETGLYLFEGKADGAFPAQRPVVSGDGSFYGITTGGYGTVYALAPPATQGAWTLSTIFTFSDGAGGSFPASGLILDEKENLYGVAGHGPGGNWGTVYELSPPAAGQGAWTVTDLHDFIDRVSGHHSTFGNGLTPTGITADEATGGLFGTTSMGGNCRQNWGCGVVFELVPPRPGNSHWSEAALDQFDGKDGDNPQSSVVVDSAGDLFGTTEDGGFHGLGTVYQLTR